MLMLPMLRQPRRQLIVRHTPCAKLVKYIAMFLLLPHCRPAVRVGRLSEVSATHAHVTTTHARTYFACAPHNARTQHIIHECAHVHECNILSMSAPKVSIQFKSLCVSAHCRPRQPRFRHIYISAWSRRLLRSWSFGEYFRSD